MALRPRYNDRGPTSSKEENERIREHMDELNTLYYDVNEAIEKLEHTSFIGNIESTTLNLKIAESIDLLNNITNSDATTIVLGTEDIVSTTGFYTDPLGELLLNPLNIDGIARVVTLPYGAETQKFKFYDNGSWYVNPEVDINYTCLIDGAAPSTTTPEEYSIDGDLSTAFYCESTSTAAGSGSLIFFITIPPNAGNIKDVNRITLYPMPSYHMTLSELQYSSSTSYPTDDTAEWFDINPIYNTTDTYFVNDFLPPTHQDLAVVNARTDFPLTRYYIRKNPQSGDRYTSLRIKFTAEDILYGDIYKVVLGIRELDLSSIIYGTDGDIWFKKVVGAGEDFTLNSISPRVVNTDIVGVYQPDVTPYYVETGVLVEASYPTNFLEGDTLYIKMSMDDGGSGDTPVIAGLNLNITGL